MVTERSYPVIVLVLFAFIGAQNCSLLRGNAFKRETTRKEIGGRLRLNFVFTYSSSIKNRCFDQPLTFAKPSQGHHLTNTTLFSLTLTRRPPSPADTSPASAFLSSAIKNLPVLLLRQRLLQCLRVMRIYTDATVRTAQERYKKYFKNPFELNKSIIQAATFLLMFLLDPVLK